ncbi:cysteine desulfurase [Pseudolabrys taiwanensis]|uniref:Cysteine desulfurase n=1 Tax=Pseudolabrys taiwanensis TaxID=331696 RepID=A0A345ZU00_9HYPH|nr:cysteine desulfurase family protein [Pseudolabrys taiwanensis]AXK80397.1 cysteine desulfurase [Pseudolabrys taiwanensis]
MSERAYFDWNATAPLRAVARDAMVEALAEGGNASSVHAEGRAARGRLEKARAQVAALVGADAKSVIFTSGATEANALALTPALEAGGRKAPRDRLFVSAVEHPSVLAGGRFAPEQIDTLPVDANGLVDLDALTAMLAKAERPLVSVLLANNETGVIQPIRVIADIVHAANGLLHVDAVQGAGRIPCDMAALGADLLSLSSHKLGGPQGAGALVRRSDIHMADPLIRGGGQERGYRAGTENVPALAGFGAAAEAARTAREGDSVRMAALRDRLEDGITAATPEAVIFGAAAPRLPNTSLVAVPGLKAETALIAFDLKGIALSSGSACSSGKVQASHVLAAMGVEPALASGALRISLGWETAETDVEKLLTAWNTVVSTLLKRQPNIAA